MFGALTVTLVSFDQFCSQVTTALHQSEPLIYGSIIVAVVVWYLLFPQRNDEA